MTDKEITEDLPIDQVVRVGSNIIGDEHEFEYISGIEVMCKKCPLGYQVGPDVTIKRGHIYIGEKLLI